MDNSFSEMLENNEHELALDVLEELGLICLPRGGFWRILERAALNMGLEDRVTRFRSEFYRSLERSKEAD